MQAFFVLVVHSFHCSHCLKRQARQTQASHVPKVHNCSRLRGSATEGFHFVANDQLSDVFDAVAHGHP